MAPEQQHPSQALEAAKQQVEKHLKSSAELQDPVAMKKLLEHYVDKVKKFQDHANDMRTKLGTDASNPENAKTLQKLHDAEEQLAMLLRHGVDTKLLSSSHAQEFSNHVDRFLEELAQAQQAPHRPRFLLSGLTPEGERQLKEEQAIKHRWETAKREMQLCVDLPYPQNNDRASGILDTAKSLINEEPQSGPIPEDLAKRAEACVQALREVFPVRDRMAWKAVSERAKYLLHGMPPYKATQYSTKLFELETKGDLNGYAEAVERMHLEALRDEKRPHVQESLSKLGKPEDLLPSAAATERMHTLLPHAEKMYEDAAKLFPSDSPELRAIETAITEADSALQSGGTVSKVFVEQFHQTLEMSIGSGTKALLRQRSALLDTKRVPPDTLKPGDISTLNMRTRTIQIPENLIRVKGETKRESYTTFFSSEADKYGSVQFYTSYAEHLERYSTASAELKQAAMKDAALAVRLSLERTSQALNHAGPLKDTPDAKELQERFAQEGKRFVELAGGFEPSSSGEVLNPTEAGAAAKAVVSHMSAQEIFTWMTELNAKVQHFTSGERRVAQQAVFAGCEEALFPKLEQMRVEGASNPELRKLHAELSHNIALALRPRDTADTERQKGMSLRMPGFYTLPGTEQDYATPIKYRFDERFSNGELAIAAAQSAMRYDEVAFRYAEKKMNFPIRAKIEAEAEAALGEWGKFLADLPSEKREAIQNNPDVNKMLAIAQGHPLLLEGLAAQYTVIEQMRAQMRNEDAGPRIKAVQQELEQAFGDGKIYRNAFQEFLTTGPGKTPEEINAVIGDPPLSAEQARAFELLSAMEGHDYFSLSDTTVGYMKTGGKIAGMIAIGIGTGMLTAGAGLGVVASLLVEATVLTTANAVVEGKGFEGGANGFLSTYGPEFALNFATSGIGRGLRGAGAMITEAAPGAVVKTSVVASEAALNTLSGAALQTALIGGDFGDNLVQCAAFAGIPIGLEAGGALRVRFKTHMEIRRAKAGLQLLASDAAALEQACKEAGVNFKKVHTVKDGEALSRLLAGNPHTERVTSTFEAFNTSRGKLQGILETAAAQAGGIDVADLTTIAREAKANPAQVLALKEILKRTEVDEATRLSLAESVLGRTLLDEEKAAVIKAHRKGGTIDNVTRAELKDKIEVLKRAFRDDAERRLLIESGICGNPAQTNVKELRNIIDALTPDEFIHITGIDADGNPVKGTYRVVRKGVSNGTVVHELSLQPGGTGPANLYPYQLEGIVTSAGNTGKIVKLETSSPAPLPRQPATPPAAAPAKPSAAPSGAPEARKIVDALTPDELIHITGADAEGNPVKGTYKFVRKGVQENGRIVGELVLQPGGTGPANLYPYQLEGIVTSAGNTGKIVRVEATSIPAIRPVIAPQSTPLTVPAPTPYAVQGYSSPQAPKSTLPPPSWDTKPSMPAARNVSRGPESMPQNSPVQTPVRRPSAPSPKTNVEDPRPREPLVKDNIQNPKTTVQTRTTRELAQGSAKSWSEAGFASEDQAMEAIKILETPLEAHQKGRKAESADWITSTLAKAMPGKPNDVTIHEMGPDSLGRISKQIVYCDASGKPITVATLRPSSLSSATGGEKWGVVTFATDRSRGIAAARGAKKVFDEIFRMDAARSTGTTSPDATKFVHKYYTERVQKLSPEAYDNLAKKLRNSP